MKYHEDTVLGLNWAGNVDVPVAYEWNPATLLRGRAGDRHPWRRGADLVGDAGNDGRPGVHGVPPSGGVAEVAWSPQEGRQWTEFRTRLGAQAPRWTALGINAYWSPTVEWRR